MLPKAEVLIQFIFISLSKLVKSEIHEVLLTRMSSNKEFINQNSELFKMQPQLMESAQAIFRTGTVA